MVRSSKNSLYKNLYSYALTKDNVMHARVPGENPENVFICHPVNDSNQEVTPKEITSVYRVECVQNLDSIAFNDDEVEYTF